MAQFKLYLHNANKMSEYLLSTYLIKKKFSETI